MKSQEVYKEKQENTQQVLKWLVMYEKDRRNIQPLQLAMKKISRGEILEDGYYAAYCLDNKGLKDLIIKKAPEEWLRYQLMIEEDTTFVGLMLDRLKNDRIKCDPDKLIHAKHKEVRFYAVKYACIDELLAQLAVEADQEVRLEIIKWL